MGEAFRIAIASGKGGTGKTTIATNLAVVLAEEGSHAAYVDCDVEEPNGHLFLRPVIRRSREVSILVPEVDASRCTACGSCGEACRYSAIVALPKKVLTFPKLCHGCGGCTLACAEGAIREFPRVTGVVEEGSAGLLTFLQGKLNVGEAMAPPVIRAVLEALPTEGTIVIDAPPGTSCPVIAAVKTADVVLLVAEPTPFGLNDLKLAVQMVREIGLPFAVAVNRAGTGDSSVFEYCAAEGVRVLLAISNDRDIARAYSRGELAVNAVPALRQAFIDLYEGLCELASTWKPDAAAKRQASAFEESHPELPPSELPPSELAQLGKKIQLRELVVISGKGGTGKTSIAASLFALAARGAVADCDVDAADLHLVLEPTVRRRGTYVGGMTAVVSPGLCAGCGVCVEHCRFDAIHAAADGRSIAYEVDGMSCEGCGVCVDTCPAGAVSLASSTSGEWFISDTRHGPMTHARLGIAQENSGKLVALVRRDGKALAESRRSDLLICDGPPGIGCPVISSISGATMVLVVTEPTLSGMHDLRRVAELCRQLNVRASVCINKADINPEVADAIEAAASSLGIPVVGRIRYDDSVTRAQVKRQPVVEDGESPAAGDIRELWGRVNAELSGPEKRLPTARVSSGRSGK